MCRVAFFTKKIISNIYMVNFVFYCTVSTPVCGKPPAARIVWAYFSMPNAFGFLPAGFNSR
jgi:hypothetical protein